MGTHIDNRSSIRCFQSLLTFIFVSICLFVLSILTYFTLRQHLMPVSHLAIPISFGFPSSFDPNNDPIFLQSPTHFPPYLVSYIHFNDTLHDRTPLDISRHSYTIELVCHSPRSYRNRHLGSLFVQLILYSTSNEVIIQHSRLIVFPYQSEIIRLVRTLILLPLSLFHIDYDRWHLKEILIERLMNHEKSKRFIEVLQLNVIPPSFQLDQCSIHFHVRDLTGLVYSFINYPLLTGCLSIFVLFSIYMTFYLLLTVLPMLNQTTKTEYSKKTQ